MSTLKPYKGHEIEVTDVGTFVATKDNEEVARSETLADLKEKVSKLAKVKVVGKPAIFKDDKWHADTDFVEGKLSSVRHTHDYSGDHLEYRVTWKDGDSNRWLDLPVSKIFKPTSSNKVTVVNLTNIRRQIAELTEQYNQIMATLEPYSEEELRE